MFEKKYVKLREENKSNMKRVQKLNKEKKELQVSREELSNKNEYLVEEIEANNRNLVESDGGGIYMFEANANIKNTMFSKQRVTRYGGGLFGKMLRARQ